MAISADTIGSVKLNLSGPSHALVTLSDFSFGDGTHGWNPQAGVWTLDPVSEPGTLVLLATTATALGLLRRHHSRRS